MHKTGWHIDLRIVITHSFEHEIPNLVFNLVSLEKKFGAIVSWILKTCELLDEAGEKQGQIFKVLTYYSIFLIPFGG